MTSLTQRIDAHETNMLINGGMDLFQRGTSFTVANNVLTYTADRWRVQNTMTTNVVVTQSTDVPAVAQSNYQSLYSLLATNSSVAAASQAVAFFHTLEGYDYARIHARKARLQFWVKSSVTGTYYVGFQNNTQGRSMVVPYSIPVASTWTPIALDISLDNAGTWQFGNLGGLAIIFNLHQTITAIQTTTLNAWQNGNFYSGTNQAAWASTAGATFAMTQVMLIPQDLSLFPTSVSVNFQRCGKTIGEELDKAKRYCELLQKSSVSAYFAAGFAASSTGAGVLLNYTEKRATPSLTYSAPSTFSIYTPSINTACTSIGTQYADTKTANVTPNSTGLTTGQPALLISNGSAAATILIDAEL